MTATLASPEAVSNPLWLDNKTTAKWVLKTFSSISIFYSFTSQLIIRFNRKFDWRLLPWVGHVLSRNSWLSFRCGHNGAIDYEISLKTLEGFVPYVHVKYVSTHFAAATPRISEWEGLPCQNEGLANTLFPQKRFDFDLLVVDWVVRSVRLV